MASTSHIIDLTSDGEDPEPVLARTLGLGSHPPPQLPFKERKRIDKPLISPPHPKFQSRAQPVPHTNIASSKKEHDHDHRTNAAPKNSTLANRPLLAPLASINTPNAQRKHSADKHNAVRKEIVSISTSSPKPQSDARQTEARRTSDLALKAYALDSERRKAKRTSDRALKNLEAERAALPPKRSTDLPPASLNRPSLLSSESGESRRSSSTQSRDRALVSSETSLDSENSEDLLKRFQAQPRPHPQKLVSQKQPSTTAELQSLQALPGNLVPWDMMGPTLPEPRTQTIPQSIGSRHTMINAYPKPKERTVEQATRLVSSPQENPRKRSLDVTTKDERVFKRLDDGTRRRSSRMVESVDTSNTKETPESNTMGGSFSSRHESAPLPIPHSSTFQPEVKQRFAFTREEDLKLIRVKEETQLSWPEIQAKYFPTRKSKTIRSRYMNHLKDKNRRAHTLNRTSLRLPRTGKNFAMNSTRVTESPEVPYDDATDEGEDEEIDFRTGSATEHLQAEYETVHAELEEFQPVRTRNRAQKKSSILTQSNLIVAPSASSGDPRSRPPLTTSSKIGLRSIPYLSYTERQCFHELIRDAAWNEHQLQWNNCLVHSDFTSDELDTIEKVITRTLPRKRKSPSSTPIRRITSLLKDVSEDIVKAIAWKAKKRRAFQSRDLHSIESFLSDLLSGNANTTPVAETLRLDTKALYEPATKISAILRQRQIGHVGSRSSRPPSSFSNNKARNIVFDSFGKTLSFTGMSHDVNSVAWDPQGDRFAAGSVCTTDASSMQYNRSKNLLFGNVSQRTLRELPDHHTLRQKPEKGLNATHAMHTTQDPRLFSTITAVDFSPSGKWLYSVGYDNYLRAWYTSAPEDDNPCVLAIQHKEIIDLMSVSPNENVIATATHRRSKSAIKVLRHGNDPYNDPADPKWSFASLRAVEKPELEIYPSSLKFEPNFGRLLLGGFNSSSRDNEEAPSSGEVCLWDVETGATLKVIAGARNCFDCSWSPLYPNRFAVGHIAGQNVNKGCHTEIRIYDYNKSTDSWGWTLELENTARDINDVIFCPYDSNYVAAGCTDATVYVWDLRRPDEFLCRLQHHDSIMPLDHDLPREKSDVGVRFVSWGSSRTRLYSGSSDGVVRSWDITQSRDDVYVKDVATMKSGIMCGSFSPDKSSLLLGEVNGSISILEVGKEDYTEEDVASFRVIEVPVESSHEEPDAESGIAAANALLSRDEIVLRPLGSLPIRQAVQGPNYIRKGPLNPVDEAAASEFQERMARGSKTRCEIPACRESAVRTTDEESGDSGRSQDRIPTSIRSAERHQEHDSSVRSGFAKCSQCGATARPRANAEHKSPDDDDPERLEILCERCDFSCFRCGQQAVVSNEADTVWCLQCDLEWSVDALGYSLRRNRHDAAKMTVDPDTPLRGPRAKTEVEKQDEEEDVANHYHSLWEDRPASPL